MMSVRKVGAEIGCSSRHVSTLLKKFGIPSRSTGGNRKIVIPVDDLVEHYANGNTPIDVAKLYGCEVSLVYKHNSIYGLKLNENKTDLKPSSDLSYLLGVIIGDGCFYKSGNYYNIVLQAVDLDFVKNFSEKLGIINGKPPYAIIHLKDRNAYVARGRSKHLFAFLSKGLKSDEWGGVIYTHPGDFVKGFFDSEGSVSKQVSGYKKHFAIRMSNTDLYVVYYIKELLHSLNISTTVTTENRVGKNKTATLKNGCVITSKKDLHTLYVRAKSHTRFCNQVGSTIARKRMIMDEIIRYRGSEGYENN